MIDVNKHMKIYNEYANTFDIKNPKISLKIAHTYRVVNFAKEIAESLNLSEKDVELAKLIGLYHDFGRFLQAAKYDTFDDSISIDHAKLAIDLLEEKKLLCEEKELLNEEKELIRTAIFHHNKKAITNVDDERVLLFCKLIRDADKLDILNIYINDGIVIKENAGNISDAIYNTALSKQLINYTDIKTDIDKYVVNIGLLFDLHFDYSIKYSNDNNTFIGLLDIIMERNPQEKEKLENLKELVRSYMDERLECQANVR
jgi:putative nucleotidyltransferase with HDIG domain